MKHAPALVKRANLLILAGLLAAVTLLPALLSQRVSAYTQPTQRFIDMASSEAGLDDVVYRVGFTPTTTGPIEAVIVDFCTSPLVGTVCVAPTGLDTNDATLAIFNEAGTNFGTAFTVDTTESTANKVVLKDASAAGSVSTAVSFELGDGSAGNGIDNPTTTGTFYARILTFANDTDADAYDSGSTGVNNPPASTVDAGGVALSTANQLTVNARVQEVLEFCVGTEDANTVAADCSDISGNTVDLGVVGSGAINISPVLAANGGNENNGLAMVRTNAVNGVVIDYFSEAVTGDLGSTHLGALRVSGATCTGDGTFATGSKTDQCFNSAGTTATTFTPGTDEGFGMTVSSVDVSNGTTSNLQRDAQYASTGLAGGTWAWSAGATDTIASSSSSPVKVVDDEMLVLRFAALAAVTTPTGQYGVTSTYVATATY